MKFVYADTPAALAGAEHLLVLAPKTSFGPRARAAGALAHWLPKELQALAQELGAEASPGLLGGAATSRTGKGTRLTVGALADQPSRHNAPSRAEGIRRLVAGRRRTIKGLFWTLKLNDAATVGSLPALLGQVREMGFSVVRARQLPSNRRDLFVFAEMPA